MHLFKNQLTNANQHVQDKARYFADCFDFYLRHLGSFGFPALETHHSLFEKIRFQLLRYDGYAKKYIQHYANNPLLNSKDDLIKTYYNGLVPLIQDLRKNIFTDPQQRARLIAEVDAALADVQNTLFKNALKEVIDVMHCPKPLVGHNHLAIIDHCTGIIVAEFLFAGFPVKDLENLMSKILTKEVKLSKTRTETPFPLPEILLNDPDQQSDPGKYYKKVQIFLAKRSLREQFEGMYNSLVAQPSDCTVVVRIHNVTSNTTVAKSYGQVTLTNNIRSILTGDKKKRAEGFAAKSGQLYFKTTLPALSFEAAEQTAIALVQQELAKFEHYFGNRLYVDYSALVIRLGSSNYYKTSYAAQRIASFDRQKNKEEQAIRKINSEAADIFLHQEGLYARAKMSDLKELKISYYWSYLESFFPTDGVNAEKIQKDVSEILANSNVFFGTSELFLVAHEILMAYRYDGVDQNGYKLSYLEMSQILNVNKVTVAWLEKAMSIADHPFLNTHLRAVLKQKVSTVRNQMAAWYVSILFETFEQRNFVQHAGINHPMAVDKLLRILPNMVMDFRSLVKQEIKKNRHKTMEAVLAQLIEPNAKLKRAIRNNQIIKDT